MVVKRIPRSYQEDAIKAVIKGFETADRGQLIMPCGTGKTLISLWIYEKLKPIYTIVLFPSLSLLKQTKDEWVENSKEGFPYLCVCSDKTIDNEDDAFCIDLSEIGRNVTTNPSKILEFMKNYSKGVIFSTYQSIASVALAIKGSDISFGLAICDEAHKTAGMVKNTFSIIHDDSLIRVSKRLYMTATPRILGDIKAKTKDYIYYVAHMDDPKVFGGELHRMNFKEAIDRDILVDYKIVAVGITDEKIKEIIAEQSSIKKISKVEDSINNYALQLFMERYEAEHVITFHSSIRRAKEFQERHQKICPNIDCFHVFGDQKSDIRHDILNKFSRLPKAIVTNARCLTEGVDIPNVDSVFFSDDKSSKIDIVQALGRTLRKSPQKKKLHGYIVIPIYNDNEKKFLNIINILRSLSNNDERIFDFIRHKKNRGRYQENERDDNLIDIIYDDTLILIDYEKAKENLTLEIVDKLKVPYVPFDEARAYAISLKLSSRKKWMEHCKRSDKPIDIPSYPDFIYAKKGWVDWMHFLDTNNKQFKTKNPKLKSYDEAKQALRDKGIQLYTDFYSEWNTLGDLIPQLPDMYYKENGWISWVDFFSYPEIPQTRTYIDLHRAKYFVGSLNVNKKEEWFSLYDENEGAFHNIPRDLKKFYTIDKRYPEEWRWFFMHKTRGYSGYYDAREIIKALNLNITSRHQWLKYMQKTPIKGIPIHAADAYKRRGWISWSHFLGLPEDNEDGSL